MGVVILYFFCAPLAGAEEVGDFGWSQPMSATARFETIARETNAGTLHDFSLKEGRALHCFLNVSGDTDFVPLFVLCMELYLSLYLTSSKSPGFHEPSKAGVVGP